jgi:NitT/TauT family transport system ATP-binding protein
VLALDKRRHDPHAPHRFGATAVYDLPLRNRQADPEPGQVVVPPPAREEAQEMMGHG